MYQKDKLEDAGYLLKTYDNHFNNKLFKILSKGYNKVCFFFYIRHAHLSSISMQTNASQELKLSIWRDVVGNLRRPFVNLSLTKVMPK